jgi:hypothetical protein
LQVKFAALGKDYGVQKSKSGNIGMRRLQGTQLSHFQEQEKCERALALEQILSALPSAH